MAAYPYKSLNLPNESRILTVLPSIKRSDPIICQLSHLDLTTFEPFEALSYCWGKSVVHSRDLNKETISISDPSDASGESALICARDTLGWRGYEYMYIGFGGALPDGTISCDGHDMPVGGELLRALQYVRGDKDSLRIWVDALCINQQDITERNEHVKMMTNIYRDALRVRVWLGDAIGLERPLFKVLDDLSEIFSDLKEELENAKSILDCQRCCVDHSKWNSVEWHILAQFLDRAWFERVWVVQEVAMAREVVFQTGPFMLPWNALSYRIATLSRYHLTEQIAHPSAFRNLVTIIDVRRRLQTGGKISEASIPSILSEIRNFKSHYPSDKIYGVLSILDPGFPIDVDYAQPAETLFTNIAIHYLQSDNLDLLYYCGEPHHPTKLDLDLPSWVPDWTRPKWTSPFFERGLKYNAAGSTKVQVSIDTASKTHHVKGRLLDAVSIVNNAAEIPIVQYDPHDQVGFDRTRAKAKLKNSLRKLRKADENMVFLVWPSSDDFSWDKYENMWRAYICNRLPDNEVPSAYYGFGWEHHIEWKFENAANEEDTDDTGPWHKFIMKSSLGPERVIQRISSRRWLSPYSVYANVAKAHKSWCYNRRFFISEEGRYGWGVDGALPGDKVAIINGCDFPFLLREAHDGTYKIIGDCYIHGLMEGEALGDQYDEIELIIS
ncbi:hypothetical protein F4808DRAFT_198479 [Astrocystis sublimbata]|nr:hypothetical protein F4808DRAFT_198479 [Astrocystis sublimbata]